MSIYAISDLHLALSVNKPMDVFGDRWSDYMEKLKYNWKQTVLEEDYVFIPGDICWATYLEQGVEDFKFIEALPGKKIISKGNHDYWWTTGNKLKKFLIINKFLSIDFMHNNSFKIGNTFYCGTKGWKCPGDDEFDAEDKKIYARELLRLEISLKSASKVEGDEIAVAMHYPPFNNKKEPSGFVQIMNKYGVKTCIYGHLHGEGHKNAVTGEVQGINFKFVSADYLKFTPLKIG